jgi:hypothetical protein
MHRQRRHARFGAALGQVNVKWKTWRGAQGGKYFSGQSGRRRLFIAEELEHVLDRHFLQSIGRAAAHDLDQLLGKCKSGAKCGAA